VSQSKRGRPRGRKPKYNPNVIFRIPEEQNNHLKTIAQSEGVTKSELLRRLVMEYIDYCTENY
jgi:predicted DNA-binding protein